MVSRLGNDMSRLQRYLNEEWIKVYRKKFEILENPSKEEIREIAGNNEVRFSADKSTKTLYVWDEGEAIHNDVWNKFIGKGRDFDSTSFKEFIHGMAEFKRGKWMMISSDEFDNQAFDTRAQFDKLSKDFKWVNKYINIDDFLENELNYVEE